MIYSVTVSLVTFRGEFKNDLHAYISDKSATLKYDPTVFRFHMCSMYERI
jgi:hypothetical protein